MAATPEAPGTRRGWRHTIDALTTERATAIALAREAGQAVEAIRRRGYATRDKADKSPVTEADLSADRLIRDGLSRHFPLDAVLTEESGRAARGESGRTWVVDPLDGTRGFVFDERGYAVQIGLMDGDTPVLGVVFAPAEGRLWWAARGQGAWLSTDDAAQTRQRVSERDDLAEMALVASVTFEEARYARIVEELKAGPRLHSVGIKVGELTGGDADIYVSGHPVSIWDLAAPQVILEEAGGAVSTFDGHPIRYLLDGGGASIPAFVASNGTRHDDICRLVRRAW